MTISFQYNKKQVIQALRYHFIAKKEIRIMIIMVNVFAIASLIWYMMGKITPVAFLTYSLLWIVLMIAIWFVLPGFVYRKAETFKHGFSMHFNEDNFTLEHETGSRSWPYTAVHSFRETPHFFHLYFDTRSFLLIPKDAFVTNEQMLQLHNLLKAKVG